MTTCTEGFPTCASIDKPEDGIVWRQMGLWHRYIDQQSIVFPPLSSRSSISSHVVLVPAASATASSAAGTLGLVGLEGEESSWRCKQVLVTVDRLVETSASSWL